jgi:CubicO group peptidase (beta-lactamase class C family)
MQMHLSADPVAYVLNKSLTADPGTEWYYSNGDVTLLSEAIRDATGLSLDKFTEQHLFNPLDIKEIHWRTIGESDVIAAGGGLEMRPRDMAKLGLLYLNGGVWNYEQIISAEWIEDATSNQVKMPYDWLGQLFGNGYGYYWWLPEYQTEAGEYGTYTAAGWGGQRISVFPSLDMVVVITGGNYLGADPADEMMEEFILPAVEQAP